MPVYRGARAVMEGGAKKATQQKNADKIGAKSQRVRKAAAKAKSASEQLSSGVLEQLDIGEMALLGRLQGQLPNRNLATLEDATKLGNGVVLAKAMAVQDAAAFNLWAQNAMIRNAKIADLSVDKLSAGSFTAGQMRLAGNGSLRAGETILNNQGVTLGRASSTSAAANSPGSKVSDPGGRGALSFFSDTDTGAGPLVGAAIRADGVAGSTHDGAILLHATENGSLGGGSTARLELVARRGGRGYITMSQDAEITGFLQVRGYTRVYGDLYVDGRIVQNGVVRHG